MRINQIIKELSLGESDFVLSKAKSISTSVSCAITREKTRSGREYTQQKCFIINQVTGEREGYCVLIRRTK